MKEKMTFGPWFGEFGWELARWNPACRYLAHTKYKDHHKIVIAPKGHKLIYEFADEYIDIEGTNYISNMATATHKDRNYLKFWSIVKTTGGDNVKYSLVNFRKKFGIKPLRFNGTLQDKILAISGDKPILAFFPRQRSHDKRRNWAIDNWINLVKHYASKGFHVFTFGGPEDKCLNFKHPNYTDFIEYSGVDELDLCVSALNLAKCGVAIQSGGIYISMYSCKATAAFGIELHRNRLAGENHLKSNYKYFAYKNWGMPVDFMVKNIDSML